MYVREPSASERLRGESPVTQFGRMGERLGIGIVAARSSQAKGRVEGNHGRPQDRWVKKRGRTLGPYKTRIVATSSSDPGSLVDACPSSSLPTTY